MEPRRVLSASVLYAIGDIAVVAVGGFLLLPLYTRALGQDEFGQYIAVRTNIEVLTYVSHLGIPSAFARLYFIHRRAGDGHAYISSVIWMFLVVLLAVSVLSFFWGKPIWAALSPAVPYWPAMPFALGIAFMGFFGAVTVLWLRAEGHVLPVVALQLGAASVVATVAVTALVFVGRGLDGVLMAILAGALVPAFALPRLFKAGFLWVPRRSDIKETLRYALPIFIGYLAHFVLNRSNIILLQNHVGPADLGVFGLAQQLSMILALVCASFGSAMQPVIFRSDADQVNAALDKFGQLLILVMIFVFATLLLFSEELISLTASKEYLAGGNVFALMAIGNFTLAATSVSETALLYHHKVKTSVTISLLSAVVAASLGIWLIAEYQLIGGAIAVLCGGVFRMIASQWAAALVTGAARWGWAFGSLLVACGIAGLAAQLRPVMSFSPTALVIFKLLILLLGGIVLIVHQRKNFQ